MQLAGFWPEEAGEQRQWSPAGRGRVVVAGMSGSYFLVAAGSAR
jgi:hypothetical protein